MLCIEWVSHTVSHQQLLMEKATILHNNHHLLLALLASSAGIELISLSVRVTSAKFQQSVGGTETGTHTPYILVICFYFCSRKFLFLLSKNMNFWFLFLLSKVEIRISNFSFYSRNSRSEFHISLSTLEIRDQNLKFLFLLSKFEIRILNFSFYSRIYFFWLSSMPAAQVEMFFFK